MSGNKKNVKFLISVDIQKLSIKKNIKFLTKVVWKRHTNKTQTSMTQHQHGFSIFNQKLYLEINLVYDQDKNCYQDKNTEFVVVIQFQGKVKSGGYNKYNIAQVINNGWKGHLQNIYLTQCPDPNAFIQLIFDYQIQGQQLEQSMSVLNASSLDHNMSRVDFNDDKLSLQMDRINQTVNKLQDLASKVKNKQNISLKKLPQLKTKLQMTEGQRDTLKNAVVRLQESLKKKQIQFKQQKKQLTKQISNLQKQLQKKTKDIRSKQLIQDEQEHYKNKYEEALKEIQQLKSMNMRQASLGLSLGIKNNLEDVQQIANFNSSFNSQDESQTGNVRTKQKQGGMKKQIQQLKRQNSQLQTNVAGMSYKLATLFNASYEYGGAKLLDHLQTSIGLTQELNNVN